jgi:hypothetical protein
MKELLKIENQLHYIFLVVRQPRPKTVLAQTMNIYCLLQHRDT